MLLNSPAPKINSLFDKICSTNEDPDLGIPKINIGVILLFTSHKKLLFSNLLEYLYLIFPRNSRTLE